jgi:DNA-binding SARP family transcriptional activator
MCYRRDDLNNEVCSGQIWSEQTGQKMTAAGSTAARLYLLGRVRLETADGREITPRSAKARGLLAYVALSPAGTAPRPKLASLLWGDSMTAMASLRQAVKEVRNATVGLEMFAADHHSLRLDLERVWVDVLPFDDLVERAADVAQIQAACARGLLEDETIRAAGFEDWLVVEETRCRQHLAHVLEDRLARALGHAARNLAVGYAEALLVLDPVHEQAHRALMRCHADAGDVAGAIRRYEVCRTALARELDLTPSIETESLLQEIRGLAGGLQPESRVAPPDERWASARRALRRSRSRIVRRSRTIRWTTPWGWRSPAGCAKPSRASAGFRCAIRTP